ncbi:MAG TPA: helix-turn-helix transcriptional regulator [Dehalococcoidia bacterium]|nr:helix-turn-helix transcriptional regulator [Dehalococcoidia bacterium]
MNKVRKIRESKGLSQVELSRLSKIAAPNLSAIERERVVPWPKAKERLAKALKVSSTELFPGNGRIA